MNMQKHNPDYKLIGVTINNIEMVYGESNTGENKGLEVYFLNPGGSSFGHYYSRRYEDGKAPMIYHELYQHLQKLAPYCVPGYKLTLEGTEYKELVNIIRHD